MKDSLHSTFVIGEIGSNHEGSLKRAFELVEIAIDAKADAVKFQLIKPFKPEWIDKLIDYCGTRIEFMASPFNENGINALRGKVKHWKIASTEAANPDFVDVVMKAAKFDTVFISDGATADPTSIIKRGPNVIPMACVVKYPAYPDDYAFGYHGKWGLSDHTTSITFPTVAVAAGAVAVEKHFTDDKKRKGDDHGHSLNPEELIQMVQEIRSTEQLFSGKKVTVTDHVGREIIWP